MRFPLIAAHVNCQIEGFSRTASDYDVTSNLLQDFHG
jgi:hypothetical protein